MSNMGQSEASLEQRRRYLSDPLFHARVEVVVRAFRTKEPVPEELVARAIYVVEALETLETQPPSRGQPMRPRLMRRG